MQFDPAAPLPNRRHERFAEAVAAGSSVTRAYMQVFPDSGYDAARSSGPRLLANASIAARVAHLSEQIEREAISAACVTCEQVLTELARIGFANMGDFMTIGPDGLPRLDWSRLTREQASALSEVTVDTISQGPTKNGQDPLPPVVRVKFKLYPKIPALEGMGRHLKMFTDTVEEEDRTTPKQHSAGARMVMELLEMKARGRLPDNLKPILDEITGRAAP